MSETLILPTASVSLLFGLDWLPLLDGRADRVAYRMARQHRATHLVIAGPSAAAVGLAHLRPRRLGRRAPLHSAAQNVARLFSSGTVALHMELDASHHWLVAVHEGAVVARTDTIHGSAAEARRGLDELRQAFPQLELLGAALSRAQAPSLATVASASGRHSRLLRAGNWHGGAPGLLRWLALIAALALLLPRAWNTLRPVRPAVQPQPAVDAGQAWRDAQERAGRAVSIHGVKGTRDVLQGLYPLPVHVAGWSLVNAACEPQAGHWQCRARYKRADAKASNATLIQAAPPAWAIDFVSIDQAEPAWRVEAAALPLAAAQVRSAAHNERHLWSALQSVQPAFSLMQLGRPAPMSVSAPRDAQGRPVARPLELPAYTVRQVRFEGPLRSMGVLLPYTESISWKKIALSFHDTHAVGLKASRLLASLHGELYEIQSSSAEPAAGAAAPPKHTEPPAMSAP